MYFSQYLEFHGSVYFSVQRGKRVALCIMITFVIIIVVTVVMTLVMIS